jgi:F-type H+-transporting ATPase subunit delta
MAELSTIARPYAQAAFKLADESGNLGSWSDALVALAMVAQHPTVRGLTGDPNVSPDQLAHLLLEILEGRLPPEAMNFIHLVAENRRIPALGEIRDQFDVLKNAREGVQDVQIVSAFELEGVQREALVALLEKSTGKKVNVHVTIDPQLICGVKIIMGDKVIDASARAQLAALESTLRA